MNFLLAVFVYLGICMPPISAINSGRQPGTQPELQRQLQVRNLDYNDSYEIESLL